LAEINNPNPMARLKKTITVEKTYANYLRNKNNSPPSV